MSIMIAILCAAGIGAGLILIAMELTRTPQQKRPRSAWKSPWHKLKERLGAKQALIVAIGTALGILLFIRTGWFALLFTMPLAFMLVPQLFSNAEHNRSMAKLEAIESWARSLAGRIGTGATTLTQAVKNSLGNAPEAIRPELDRLTARLTSRWTPKRAYQALADDLDDPTGDLLAAHLILASEIKVSALPNALHDLAEMVFDEVKARREIDSARETNRTTARLASVITLGLLILAATFMADFFSVYATPVGQLVLALLLFGYIGALRWMRNLSRPDLPPRILLKTEGATQ